MKKTLLPAAIALASLGVSTMVSAQAAPAAPAAPAASAAKYTTAATEFGVLWDDPAAKAIVVKHLPDLGKPEAADSLQMARSMTLRTLQSFKPDFFAEEKLTAIDAELATLPPK